MGLTDFYNDFKTRQRKERAIKKKAEEKAHEKYLKELEKDEYKKQLKFKKSGGHLGKLFRGIGNAAKDLPKKLDGLDSGMDSGFGEMPQYELSSSYSKKKKRGKK